jgi:probable rRNA maturation factor
MSRVLTLRNRQRARPVNLPFLRRIANELLAELLPSGDFDLGVYLVTGVEITRLNETYLRHAGPTDVITFNHAAAADVRRLSKTVTQLDHPHVGGYEDIHGEIFICLDEAVAQARRFRTTWQSELTRYLIHGLLHLCGYDDQHSADRRKMKREENQLLQMLSQRFSFARLAQAQSPRSRGARKS